MFFMFGSVTFVQLERAAHLRQLGLVYDFNIPFCSIRTLRETCPVITGGLCVYFKRS